MKIDLEGGGELAIERFDGERAQGTASRALPPGSRPDGSIEGRRVRLKVERCTRDGDRFRVRARLIDLERDLRERILAATSQPEEPSPR